MHPAPSLIAFSSLSGLGLGWLAWLCAWPPGAPWPFLPALALAAAGLALSTLHLRRPSRAALAWTQWRSSWLSREALLAPSALALAALHAALTLACRPVPALGIAAAVLCVATVAATAMIYAQMRTVPRWRHPTTPALFVGLSLAGGAMLAGHRWLALGLLGLALTLQILHWRHGATAFARLGVTAADATGLQGSVRSFAPPHTGPNYVLREMVHVVARRRAAQLRLLTLVLAFALPAALLLALPPPVAALPHLVGVVCSRWLFLAEAEHVVGLYYGAR